MMLLLIGFVVWVIESAPFISETIKPFIRWGAIVIGGLFLIKLLFGLFNLEVPKL